MSQIHKSRKSGHPLIETVWQSENISDGTYLATPDRSWDLIAMTHQDGSRQMMLTGQATKPSYVPYVAGTSSVVISFVPSAYLPSYPSASLIDSFEFLPTVDATHFHLAGYTFAFPDFDTAEELVEQMLEHNILKSDPIVDGTLEASSDRTVQRHYAETTGMPRKTLEQIERAQQAVTLLQKGERPVDAAADSGYSDQPHLTKSLKKIMGISPTNVDDIHKL
jgi:AraC-like DNA-binding protein